MTESTRINKALSILGICSRRDADKLILNNQVSLNHKIINELGLKVSYGDTISVFGKDYIFQKKKNSKIWIYYKPIGLVTTHKDEKGRKTVFDDLKTKIKERVISVGRLDLNSEGLLLLTNDSDFSKQAETSNWKRYYKVRIFGKLTSDIISKIQEGVTIDNINYAPMEIQNSKVNQLTKNQWINCVLTEGKNREIRKIFNHFQISVNRLIRYKYGAFELGDLKPGEVRLIKSSD